MRILVADDDALFHIVANAVLAGDGYKVIHARDGLEALELYRKIDHRLGEANVQRGLGELERTLGRKLEARAAFSEAAKIFATLGMTKELETATAAARKLE